MHTTVTIDVLSTEDYMYSVVSGEEIFVAYKQEHDKKMNERQRICFSNLVEMEDVARAMLKIVQLGKS